MAIVLSVRRRRFHEYFVHVAPRPILAALEASNEWMFRLVKVLRGVFVRRLITAPDVATREAEAKMHPTRVHLETLLAPLRCARSDLADLIEMAALRSWHHYSMKIVGWQTPCAAALCSARQVPYDMLAGGGPRA